MPLVKNTETGNHYLVKINTDGDACSRTAIRSYDKQTGSEGATVNTVFSLPFTYEPNSHTLWIYVNGQKAEYIGTTGTPSNVQLLHYFETDVNEVTFATSLEADDVIEFIVAGNYDGDVSSGSIGDLTDYLRRDGSNTFTGSAGNLDLTNNAKIVNTVAGTNPSDVVIVSQLTDNSLHKHQRLYDTGGVSVVDTTAGYLNMGSNQIKTLANGTIPSDAVNKAQLDTKINISGTLPFTGNQSMGNKKLTAVAVPTDGADATNKTYVDGTYYNQSLSHIVFTPGAYLFGGQSIDTGTWGSIGYKIHPDGNIDYWMAAELPMDGYAYAWHIKNLMIAAGFGWVDWAGNISFNANVNFASGSIGSSNPAWVFNDFPSIAIASNGDASWAAVDRKFIFLMRGARGSGGTGIAGISIQGHARL